MKFGISGRGRWVMHNDIAHDPIQSQGQGHGPLEVEISAIFKVYLLRHLSCDLKTGHRF